MYASQLILDSNSDAGSVDKADLCLEVAWQSLAETVGKMPGYGTGFMPLLIHLPNTFFNGHAPI